jgi:hypothetical protein
MGLAPLDRRGPIHLEGTIRTVRHMTVDWEQPQNSFRCDLAFILGNVQ